MLRCAFSAVSFVTNKGIYFENVVRPPPFRLKNITVFLPRRSTPHAGWRMAGGLLRLGRLRGYVSRR